MSSFIDTKMLLHSILLFSVLVGDTFEDDITPTRPEVYSSEGSSVTLSCNYRVKANTLQWYQQYHGTAPQFLLLLTDISKPTVVKASPPHPRLSVERKEERNRVDLIISSAEVTDSALYYCALTLTTGGSKIIFGKGIRLHVESREEYKPSYFTLKDDSNTTACLATDFSNYNDTLNGTEPTRMQGDKYYSQVALNQQCPGESDKCAVDTHEIDLIILGLRILFMKTIVFNVLMTFRVWMG